MAITPFNRKEESTMPLKQPSSTTVDPPDILFAPTVALNIPILIGFDQLVELGVTYSREHLRRMEAAGQFPGRVRLSPARVAWMSSEVIAWLNERAEERPIA
ncbi:helix-turn-helix transcriptional regulator [Ovoidimarina sediminis]|uniref:helix-turn-helix transcriptional regulator n=1 Tax=Ovoidimarina sediminis TaxID=3079856 RepID=UPI00290C5338|nr:AlpA family phage regulatory protein [Rhodophyticola sp. MJ-SS7]MDU8945941.1 AlpA family phage regulatory protein [Rhodophyticola sp. MJ-SS7]